MSATAPVIVSLGSINADFQVRVAQPLEAGRSLHATDFLRLGGGKASNVALLAQQLGHRALLLGRVGCDDLAEQALAPLRAAGIDLAGVSRASGPTAVAMISVAPDGDKQTVLATNANGMWDTPAIDAACRLIADCAAGSVLVVDGEVPARVVREALAAARGAGLRAVLDPSPPEAIDLDWLQGLHAVVPNAKETEGLVGIAVRDAASAARAARALRERGVALAGVRLADGGCVLAAEDGVIMVSAPAMAPVDTTGAGDAFTGAFAVAVFEGRAPAEAACFGVAAASFAVQGYGSRTTYPSRAQLDAALPWYRDKVRLDDG